MEKRKARPINLVSIVKGRKGCGYGDDKEELEREMGSEGTGK